MATECFNSLEITTEADSGQLELFIKQAMDKKSGELLSFSKLLPPPALNETNENWNNENWGTKSDPFEVEFHQEDDTYAVYSFFTESTPPIAFLKNISQQFPLLNFYLQFEEPRASLYGNAMASNGNVQEEDTRETEEPKNYIYNACMNDQIRDSGNIISTLHKLKGLISEEEFAVFFEELELSERMKQALKQNFAKYLK
jgi:hypothetical protein